jgi:hypothetical protein
VVLAQSLNEYGSITSIVTMVGEAAYVFSEWTSRQPPATWFVAGAIGLLILRSLLRRRGL